MGPPIYTLVRRVSWLLFIEIYAYLHSPFILEQTRCQRNLYPYHHVFILGVPQSFSSLLVALSFFAAGRVRLQFLAIPLCGVYDGTLSSCCIPNFLVISCSFVAFLISLYPFLQQVQWDHVSHCAQSAAREERLRLLVVFCDSHLLCHYFSSF